MRRAFAATAVVLALALAGPAHGEEDEPGDEPTGPGKPSYSIECAAPCLQYEGDFEIEYGGTRFKADGVTSHDVGPSVDTDLKYRPLDWLVFSGHFVTEPVLDLEPGDDRAFADIGAFAEELNVQLLFGDFEVIAGKFHPASASHGKFRPASTPPILPATMSSTNGLAWASQCALKRSDSIITPTQAPSPSTAHS